MVGEITKTGSGGPGPLRIRPHWWAVLAVSLSLLALVAASASDRPTAPGHRQNMAAAVTGHHDGARLPAAPTPTSVPLPGGTILTPTTTTPTSTTSTSTSVGSTSSPGSRPVVNAASAPTAKTVTTVTTVTTTTATPSTGASSAAAPIQSAAVAQDWNGALQEPDYSSASHSFTGAGPMQVSATWSSTLSLSLTVSCPEETQTEEGPSSLTIPLADATGACEVTLKELVVQYDAISYTLTVSPVDGG